MTGKSEYTIDKLPASESETLFRGLFENSSDAIQILDNFTFVECNQATVKILRAKNKEEVLLTHPSQLSPECQPDGRPSSEKADEMIRTALEKGGHHFEWMHRRVDGEDFLVEVMLTPVIVGGKTMLYSSWRDITDRKRAEAAVRDNEEKLRAIYEGANDAIMLLNEKGFFDCNPQTLKMFGFQTKEQFTAMHPSDASPASQPDGRDSESVSRAHIQTAYRQGYDRFEWVHRRSNGEDFPAEVVLSAFNLGGQQVLQATVRDITERQQAEAKMQQEKSFSDAIINGLPGSFYLFDLEGKMIRWNKKYEEISGYSAEEIPTMSVIDTLAEEDREAALTTIQRALVEGQGAVEAKFITKDGRSIPYYFAGQRLQIDGQIYMAGTGMDLTERKQAELELQREKVLSDAIINSLPGIFYMFDTEGRFVRWNKNYENMLGMTAEEVANSDPSTGVAEEDIPALNTAIEKALTENAPASLEASIISPSGERIPFYFTGNSVTVGDQVYILGVGQDITERKRLDAQIQEAFERRGLQVQLSTQVSQSIAAASSLEELYERVVTQVKEQFGYYHTQLLRYEEAQDAVVLVTGYGETGAKMLAAGHRMPMGEGLIGTAATTGETLLRPTLESDPDWHPNPLLPETKGEIAVPIKLGDDILGVLDVQSSVAGALGADDQLLLEGLCGQIATAIESTRLRQEMAEQAQKDILLRDRALDSSINAVFITDLHSKVIYANDAFLKLSGYTREEALQLAPDAFISNPETAQSIGNAIQTQGFYVGEDIFKHKDGSVFPIDYFASSIKDAEGKPIATQASFINITERKQAEIQLQQEKSFSDTIINGLPGTFYLFDLQGKMLRWNKQYEQVSGYSAEEIPTMGVADSIAEEDRERVAATIQRAFMEGQATVEANIVNKDGKRTPYYLTGQRLQIGDQVYLVGTGVDITERKQAERALRESQQFLQTIMDNIPQSIFWKDNNLAYLGCNSAFAADTGLASPNDVIGKTDWDMPWKEQAEAYRADDSLVMKNGVPKLNYEEPQTTPDGQTSWLRTSKIPLYNIDGDPFAVLGMYEDITERKQAEVKVQEAQQLLESFLENFPDAAWVKDLEGRFLIANRYLVEDIYGTTLDNVIGKNVYDLFPKEVADFLWESELRLIKTGETLSVEESLPQADGKTYDKITTKFPLYDTDGNVNGLGGILIDITERKKLDAQVREALERRGLQVQLSTQVSQSIAAAASLEELYERVVMQVKEQFGYYHTQILRYDEAQEAVVLVTGYGETGAKMLATGHRMPMGEGLIGTAASTGETILRPTLESDPDWHPNPLLPETKGEIAVPIKLGDNILGVLDVQSSTAGALDADDQLLLEGLCGQIATAIESTRLRQEMAERLEEVNRLYRAMSHEGWETYRQATDIPSSFMYDQAGLREAKDVDLTDELFANVPLAIPGGEVIGTLAVADDPQRPITPEDEAFLQQVSEQLALALESARLFEQTQSALMTVQESQTALDQAMDVAGMANWNLSFETFKFTFNERLYQMLGTTLEEEGSYELSAEEYTRKYIHPEDGALIAGAIQTGLQDPDPRNFKGSLEYRMLRKDGQMRYMLTDYRLVVNEQGKTIGGVGSFLDVTERKLAELAVAKRAAELATVAKVGTTTAATLEPDRLLQSVVDLAKEQFGLYHAHIYTYDESWNTLLMAAGAGEVGRKLVAEEHAIPMSLEQSLVARAARERKAIIVNDVISEPGFLPNPLLPETRAEMAVPMTAGDKLLGVFDVQSSSADGFSEEDKNIYVTLAAQVSVALQNARMYVEQAALVTQLRELDRLKSSFLANMSHELRTPLNSILGFADVIIEELDGPLTENMSNDLRLIQKNGQHLLHLINDVLDMSKIEAGRMNLSPENFKATEVLEEVTSITSTLASEKNLALFIEEDSDREVSIYADRTRLRQVMINLVNNAIKFTENGKISLKIAPMEGARIMITIKDTGIGIPPDKLDVIFQEFTQVDSSTTRKVGGTGLGLPISRRLVEMHGGRVWAESTGINGQGSTFFVELPVEARITEVIEKQAK